MTIKYQEHSIETVIKYFADGYENKPERVEWFYDPNKGIVVFKLYMKEEGT